MTIPDPLKLARDAQSALPLPALWLAWNTSYTGIRFWTADAAVAEAQAATGLALTGFYSAEQMRAAIDALPAGVQTGGSAEHMLQDQSRDLSRWLSNQPGARLHATEAAAAIAPASAPSASPASPAGRTRMMRRT